MHWLLSVRPAFLASFLKKALRVKRNVVVTDEGSFYIDPLSNFGNNIVKNGKYEADLSSTVKQILEEGDTFIDAGANEGYFSIIASKVVGKTGKVIAIEPQSRLQSILLKNIGLNESFNVLVCQAVIADVEKVAELHLSPDMNTGSSGLYRSSKYSVPTEIVRQITLEQLFDTYKIGKAKLIKIDVESYEYELILGSKKLFQSGTIKNIALELHPTILASRNLSEIPIIKFLTDCGYTVNSKYKNLIYSL